LKPFVSRVLLLVTLLVAVGAARTYATTSVPVPRTTHVGSRPVSHRLPDGSGTPSAPHRSHARRAPRFSVSSLRHSRNARSGQRSSLHGYDLNRRFSPVAQGFSLSTHVERKRLFIDSQPGRAPPSSFPDASIPLRYALLLIIFVLSVFSPPCSIPSFTNPEVGPFSSTTSIPMRSLPGGPLCASFPRPSVGDST